MTNAHRDRMLLLVLKKQTQQDVWIKWIFGIVAAGMMTKESGDKIGMDIRTEMAEIDAEFESLEAAMTFSEMPELKGPTTIN